MLEPFEEKLGELLDTARPAPALSQEWPARAQTRMAAVAGKADRKETMPMRRLAYVMALLLVMGLAAAGVFSRSRPLDGKALLASALQAMETARSVHLLGRGFNVEVHSPTGLVMSPRGLEVWMSWRSIAARSTNADGTLASATTINLDTGEWRDYSSGVEYQADLTPAALQVARIIVPGVRDVYALHMLTKTLLLTDSQQTVATTVSDGREITVVTLTGIPKDSPRLVRERDVFQIDRASGHLLAYHRYVRAKGAEEQSAESVEQVDYNVPVPADLAPKEAIRKPATVSIQQSAKFLSLVMSADGKEIRRIDAPK